jgi:hypothetical protein
MCFTLEMKKLILRLAVVGVLVILAVVVFASLQFRGTIPIFADTSDVSYAKLCGFDPLPKAGQGRSLPSAMRCVLRRF